MLILIRTERVVKGWAVRRGPVPGDNPSFLLADHPSKTLIFPCCNRLFHLLASVASAWIKAVSREIVVSGLRQRFWARERIGV
jgi:hypothetical protein